MEEIDEIMNELMGGGKSSTSNDTTGKFTVASPDEEDTNEFGAIPVVGKSEDITATILGVFTDVDVSPLTVSLMNEEESNQTIVFYEVDNQTSRSLTYGNDAITYILDNRLKISPTSGTNVVWDPENIGPVWNRAPGPGTIAEIEPGIKSRWASLVEVPDLSKLDMIFLNERSSKPIVFELPDSVFADNSNLPF